MMKIFKSFIVFSVLAVFIVIAAKDYFGYHYYYKYKKVRGQAESIEKSFSQLELNLKKAVSFSKNHLFYKEMGRLYLERALAENQFGTAEKRDFYLDRARESLIKAIRKNQIDAFAYYRMGTVYLLYNYPLLTYVEKAKRYFRKAIELSPADEFLNENIVYIYLTQWDWLEEEEKRFVEERMQAMKENNQDFVHRLRRRWQENYGGLEKLEDILGPVD